MNKHFFFPHDRLFWWYHLSGLLVLALVQTVIIALWREEKLFNFAAGAVWLPLFTLAVLGFRAFYKYYNWYQYGAARTIPIVVLYGLATGFFVTLLMFGIVTPFFWSDIANQPDVLAHKISASQLMLQMIIGNSLQTQIFVCSWIFIYISVSSNRRIRETELHNLRLQNSLKEAQLVNLGNQLNPHFLFNALNNIRFTIHENPEKADAMITALSEILRYSLESSKHEKVPVSEELAIIDRYIAIVKIQMESRLVFEKNIPEKLLPYLMPPMILQLLVENAIKHGIDELRYGGVIVLEGYEHEHDLKFMIKNNKPAKQNTTLHNMGIGLANIEQRLHLLYGDKASLKIVSTESNFSVVLLLPKEKLS